MVFVNNRKVNHADWKVEPVVSSSNGRTYLSINMKTALNTGDRIHIFYLPEAYEEILLTNHLSKFDDIIIDASGLEYTFDKDLFMINVDGKKINNNDIQNISMNRVRITTDYPEYSNVCVCKYLNPDALLEKVFSYGDMWSNAVESITTDQYEKLFVKA